MTLILISRIFVARITSHKAVYLSVLALAGCTSMAGVGGSAEFGCKAPAGVKCDSVSGTYYNALQQNLPSQQKSATAAPDASVAPTPMDHLVGKRAASTNSIRDAALTNATVTALAVTREANAPLRSPARVLRLWIKPWEDSDGDLHSQSYVYVPIDAGRWLVDHYRSPAREPYAPPRAPRTVKGAVPTADSAVTAGASRSDEDAPLFSGSRAAGIVRRTFSGERDGDAR
jgi:conjugal transfer pilus assembly protein TraV